MLTLKAPANAGGDSAKVAPKVVEIKYWEAVIQPKGELVVRFKVQGRMAKITLPMPQAFRDHKWKQTIYAPQGKKIVAVEDRDMWTYVDAVVEGMVTDYLTKRGVKGITIKAIREVR
jgi:hypothetical protein